ncbi:hypothetical protein [Arcobacter aquimarinus]|uniref:Membrane protein n=1 Tax=Arcobacter aquimarinus TaxID=1315211 RepID=A0AAE7E198_9BACT|nr:hypothetical protein [Arcobacter aquimarinus]QKE25899.1 putative membrane protein [Arcobacter aquimarinus]RXI35600.1 hypothetical protein CP986_05745 [Arcobacter aquimarinus]
MDKEEKKKLENEFKQLKRSEYDKAYDKVINFFLVASIVVFLIPTNILSVYPILKSFTQFMAKIFPNITIYAQRSRWSEVTEFYFSYMWIVALITIVLIIMTIPTANEKAEKYFGTGKYKHKGILNHKYLIFVPQLLSFKYFLLITAAILLSLYGIYINYTGSLIDGEISRLKFGEIISTRFGMLFIAVIFQVIIIHGLVVILIRSILNTIHIQKIKKGE